ncbi:MAG TPA: SUMF1/EgtB/PvdO family nonheme iron enzyme [Verrucomicrobiae bacterium]
MRQHAHRLLALLGAVVGILVLFGSMRAFGRWRAEHAQYAPPPEGMVIVPAGWFWMGSDEPESEPDERPRRRVYLPAYYIDVYEVTNREFKRFKPAHNYPEGEDSLPVTKVFKPEAIAYAEWAGKRLPSNAEWEKAARGTDGRRYPWGDQFETNRANLDPEKVFQATGKLCVLPITVEGRRKIEPGIFPLGASPYGAMDMAGNVWEWVSDNHKDSVWLHLFGERGERGIIRGGAYAYSPQQARTSHQAFEALNSTCNDVGFRCVMPARRLR